MKISERKKLLKDTSATPGLRGKRLRMPNYFGAVRALYMADNLDTEHALATARREPTPREVDFYRRYRVSEI